MIARTDASVANEEVAILMPFGTASGVKVASRPKLGFQKRKRPEKA